MHTGLPCPCTDEGRISESTSAAYGHWGWRAPAGLGLVSPCWSPLLIWNHSSPRKVSWDDPPGSQGGELAELCVVWVCMHGVAFCKGPLYGSFPQAEGRGCLLLAGGFRAVSGLSHEARAQLFLLGCFPTKTTDSQQYRFMQWQKPLPTHSLPGCWP